MIKLPNYIVHGGDYNPDQWLKTPEMIDDDMRLMKEAHINSATVGIFSWSMLEPEEGVFRFEWLDDIMDKLNKNGIGAILATPSGARPAWLAESFPEVLRVNENGIRNEYGVRHNHCLTSPVYREKVRIINTALAERYAEHPALTMWHVSNEYSGECHCEKCQQAFREWVREYYHNDLDELNDKWWTGFWSHRITDWSQINSPKERGENHSSALKLCWDRFVTESHISFYENEAAPLRRITPDIPITTNFMRMYDRIDYQKFAKHLDIVSWDNYPDFTGGNIPDKAVYTAFCHDMFRSMKNGQPFFMMESTPSIVNGRPVNKLPRPGIQTLTALQAVAHGADSVQYFQWRKSRGGHEKFHGAVVDHSGRSDTRVFREITRTGSLLEALGGVTGARCESKAAVICDFENSRAVKHFCGYNNERRDYFDECVKWYRPFTEAGISVDVITMDADFDAYGLVIAPFLYMLKDGVEEKIREYVRRGGHFLTTYLSAVVDSDDLCFLGGLPAGSLKEVFGISVCETDSLFENAPGKSSFLGKEYDVEHVCDILSAEGAAVLGEYKSDFYAGKPSFTENSFGKGTAYYAAFRNDGELSRDVCAYLVKKAGIKPDTNLKTSEGVIVRKRGEFIFVMNFTNEPKETELDGKYIDVLSGEACGSSVKIGEEECRVLKQL
ncbi:MAG: beta-galactosidase [Clostridiales bacterium]|nr:beta-galactosidase [Clostridiales bacterium]